MNVSLVIYAKLEYDIKMQWQLRIMYRQTALLLLLLFILFFRCFDMDIL